jgi:hypothetical protein
MSRFSDSTKTISMAMAFCLAALYSFGQVDSSVVVVHVDYRAELLAKKQSQINRLSVYKNSSGQYKGYRIMIINTNNRDLAYKMRGDVLRYFPSQAVYMAYQAPYFKLKAGDFLKREDAEKFRKELSKYFTESFFIVNDIIKVSPEEEARLLAEQEAKQY